jgi:large conductance mechanosensitive channel
MLKDFKKFILRGNVVDLAVGVVIGAAFGTVVSSLVKDVFTPLIAAIAGKTDFSTLSVTLRGSQIFYGNFINAIVAFIVISAVIFFLVVQPLNKLTTMANRNKPKAESHERECPECLSNIPKKAKRCMFCTANVKPLK